MNLESHLFTSSLDSFVKIRPRKLSWHITVFLHHPSCTWLYQNEQTISIIPENCWAWRFIWGHGPNSDFGFIIRRHGIGMNDVCFLYAHDGQQMHGLCACVRILARHAWYCVRLCNDIRTFAWCNMCVGGRYAVSWGRVVQTLRGADLVLELVRVELNGKCHCLWCHAGGARRAVLMNLAFAF